MDDLSSQNLQEDGHSQLSKNALKKLKKRERALAIKTKRKEERKGKKQKPDSMPKEEPKPPSLCPSTIEQETKLISRSKRRKLEFESLLQQGAPHVIIDCWFPGKMREREISSLTQQILFTYGLNKGAAKPFHLGFFGLFPELHRCCQKLAGFTEWQCTIREAPTDLVLGLRPDSIKDTVLDKVEKYIYLTADAEDTLLELDDQTAYIIGGIVDRNRYKGLTASRAREWGLSTARLPISEHMPLAGSKVLTVNQGMCFF